MCLLAVNGTDFPWAQVLCDGPVEFLGTQKMVLDMTALHEKSRPGLVQPAEKSQNLGVQAKKLPNGIGSLCLNIDSILRANVNQDFHLNSFNT